MLENTRFTKKAKLFAAGILTGLLVACGGGSNGCTTLDPARDSSLPSCTTSSTAASTGLFTTAPSAVTMTSGGGATYTIGGGTAPYTATSGNMSVATTSLAGTTLTINSIAAGTAPIAIVDSTGKTVMINVTVLSTGDTGIPPSIFPASITTGDCTTNIPFIFSGGTAPFTIFTSDNIAVPVSVAMPLGAKSFFMASVRSLFLSPDTDLNGVKTVIVPRVATVTVLDSQSRVATATITIPLAHPTCPDNPLLQTAPASANAHVTEILAFQITGGLAPYSFASSAPEIVNVIGSSATSFNAQAIAAGTALLTVTSTDGQKANITFTVF